MIINRTTTLTSKLLLSKPKFTNCLTIRGGKNTIISSFLYHRVFDCLVFGPLVFGYGIMIVDFIRLLKTIKKLKNEKVLFEKKKIEYLFWTFNFSPLILKKQLFILALIAAFFKEISSVLSERCCREFTFTSGLIPVFTCIRALIPVCYFYINLEELLSSILILRIGLEDIFSWLFLFRTKIEEDNSSHTSDLKQTLIRIQAIRKIIKIILVIYCLGLWPFAARDMLSWPIYRPLELAPEKIHPKSLPGSSNNRNRGNLQTQIIKKIRMGEKFNLPLDKKVESEKSAPENWINQTFENRSIPENKIK